VAQIDTSAVLAVSQPISRRFPETSSRLRGRIEAVLDYAKARGFRTGENPAAWRGHLALILPKHGTAPRHHAAMPYGDVPAFVTCLHMSGSISSQAMEFAILTTARPGEVLGARWTEIDPDKKVWTVPASCMKGGREHRVPLPGRAAAVLVDLAKGRTGEFIFPGQHPNKARFKPNAGNAFAPDESGRHAARVPIKLPRLGGRGD
jgi:integrase